MSKSASTGMMNQLHEMLASVLLEDLATSRREGIPLPAANLSVIRQFLKDNDISAVADAEDMVALRDEFADELAARREYRKSSMKKALSEDDGMADILG